VVYRGIKEVKAALLFSSGKVVFTGATERSAIEIAFTQLKKKLERFKKRT
jgi:TATA-box binding protein (TBP) (component of TFIID and TFIIIB)